MTRQKTASGDSHTPDQLERLRPKLMNFFRWNRCLSPEDETQETMSRTLERMSRPDTNIHVPLQAFVFGIARNVLRESWRQTRETPADPAGAEFTNLMSAERLDTDDTVLVAECLSRLSKIDQHFVLEYHRRGAALLAKEMGISANAVRIRVCRLHKELQELMLKENS